MKKYISLALILSLALCFLPVRPVYASHDDSVIDSYCDTTIEYLDDGSYIVTKMELTPLSNANASILSTDIGATRTSTYYSSSGTALCALKITGTFRYTGSSVSCVGTKATKYSYNSSWSVENVSTSHGNTSSTKAYARAEGEFVKKTLGITVKIIPTSITVYCDKNGNLS